MPELSRLERWKTSDFLSVWYTFAEKRVGHEDEAIERLNNIRDKYYQREGLTVGKTTTVDMTKLCKELIYDVVDGKPVFHAVGYSYNVSRAEVEVGLLFDVLLGEDEDA